MNDKEKWRERNNRAWLQAPAGSIASGLAILVSFVDGISADLSNLRRAHLRAADEIIEELRHLRKKI